MSTALKQAAVDEALELSYLFRQNAALTHGLPDCAKTHAKIEVEKPVKQDPPVVNVTIPAAPAATDSPSPGATAAAAVKSSLLRRAAPWLLAIAGAGGGAVVNHVMRDEAPPPAIEDPSGSLLQYLEDRGYHRREGEW